MQPYTINNKQHFCVFIRECYKTYITVNKTIKYPIQTYQKLFETRTEIKLTTNYR